MKLPLKHYLRSLFISSYTCLPLFQSGLSDVLQGSLDSVEGRCKACGSHDEEEGGGCEEVIATNGNTSCSCPNNTKQGKDVDRHYKSLNLYVSVDYYKEQLNLKKFVFPDLSPHSNGSDCGYSSSMEGSETGSREGSDIACSEGICNHDEAGPAKVAMR